MVKRHGKVRRSGARLALFALALQLVLSFGHMHAEDFLPRDAAGSGAATLLIAGRSDAPQAPDRQAPALPDDHDGCAICASMQMAGSLVLPAPIPLPEPARFEPPAPAILAAPAPRTALRLPFQTRAPPTA